MLSLCQHPSPPLLIPCLSSQRLSITSLHVYFFIADFPQPSISVLCFPPPPPSTFHSVFWQGEGWIVIQLTVPSWARRYEGAFGIRVLFLHLAPYQSCLWFSTTGQRKTSSGFSAPLFCLRSCSTEVLCFFRYENEVASCAAKAQAFQATWKTTGGETKRCIWRILVNKRDILRHQSPGSLPWPRKTFHWAL